MLDRDELLPAEQTHPVIVEQLRAAYRMKSEEEQALLRVRERLAQSSALPLPGVVQADEYAEEQHLVSPFASPSRDVKAKRKWSKLFNTLAAAIVAVLLVGSLVFAFVMTGRTNVGSSPAGTTVATNSIRVLLAAAKGSHPTQAAMDETGTLLLQRFRDFGLKGIQVHVMTGDGRPEILAVLPHFGDDEQHIIAMLVEGGSLAFWNTGSMPVPLGATFNPADFARYNSGGRPAFTNKDLNLGVLMIIHDQAGRPQISCIMRGDAISRFQKYTAEHVGDSLTVTLDDKVIESAVIQSAIEGPFVLSIDFTEQQSKALIAIIAHGPLPVELQRVS